MTVSVGSGTPPIIDALIVNWNSGVHLRTLLSDLSSQQDVVIRVLVVDNASTDDSLLDAANPTAQHRVLQTGRNLGYAGGNNAGFAELTTSDLILIVNPDVRLSHAKTLSRLARILLKHREFAAIAPTIRNQDGLIEYQRSVVDLDRAIAVHVDTHRPNWPAGTPELVELPWIDGAALLVRRAALDDCGSFDDQFFLFQEEVDWCLRVRQKGWRVGLARDAHISHERSSSFGTSTKGAYYYWRNLYLLCSKHADGRWGWRWHWAVALIRFALRPRHLSDGQAWAAMAAAADAVRARFGPARQDR